MKIFKRTGMLHTPVTIWGYLIYVIAVAFLVLVFITIDRNSHSVSDTLFGVFPYFAGVFLLVEWFASKTSK